ALSPRLPRTRSRRGDGGVTGGDRWRPGFPARWPGAGSGPTGREGSVAAPSSCGAVAWSKLRAYGSSVTSVGQPAERCNLRNVVQIRRQPALGLRNRPAFAARVVLDLVAADAAEHEVAAVGMAEVVAAHGRRRQHGLVGVLGAGGVAGGGAEPPVLLGEQRAVVERLVGRLAPQFPAHALVHALGQRLGQPVGEGLEQDGAVVVMRGLEACDVFVD